MNYHENPEYRKAEFDDKPSKTNTKRASLLGKINAYIERRNPRVLPDEHFYIALGYFAAFVGTIGGAAIFVDQKEAADKYNPINIPRDALFLEQTDLHTRRFGVSALEANQVTCGGLNVGQHGTTYKNFMPSERAVEKIENNTALIISGHSTTGIDTIVSCSYPDSDPAYIQKIPIIHR